jgi:hypothetical protein
VTSTAGRSTEDSVARISHRRTIEPETWQAKIKF